MVGLTARTPEGEEVGRISEVLADEESGVATHVILERGEQRFEIPLAAITPYEDADFATFHADRSDEEPGDHVDDEVEGYAPLESEVDDREHEGQFVAEPQDPVEAQSGGSVPRESGGAGSWQDEESTSPDSGYPRNDAYIDPDTSEEGAENPRLADEEGPPQEVEVLLENTQMSVRAFESGIVALTGSAASQDELEGLVEEIMGVPEVLEVDATDVEVLG